MFFQIAILILPVFLIIIFGFLCRHLKILIDGDVDTLISFCQNIGIPILLFYNILNLNLNIVFEIGIWFSYYFSLLACFFIGFLVTKYFFSQKTEDAIAFGFCAMFSNGVLLGLPICALAFGEASLSINYGIIVGHGPICYLLGIVFMEVAKAERISFGTSLLSSVKSIFSNNLSIGIFCGLILNLVGFQFPSIINESIEIFIVISIPLALFSLGGVLYKYKISKNLKISIFLIFISLVIQPFIVFSLGNYYYSLNKGILANGIIMAAMAPGLNSYFFANMYNSGKEVIASTIFLGTIITIFSSTAWIYVIS